MTNIDKFRFALIGNNVTYSRSTDIFNCIFSLKNIKGSCEIINIEPNDFEKKFQLINESQVDGVSVTIPFKKEVIQYLDEIDPIAEAIQAVNSIHFSKGKRIGYNTDCYGFSKPLHNYSGHLKHGNALILGAGGAAKAVVYTLYTDYEIKDFTIFARDIEKLHLFKESLSSVINSVNLKLCTQSDKFYSEFDNRYSIGVNCTPLRGWNKPELSPLPEKYDWSNLKLYYDLNYNRDNQLINKAREGCIDAFDGSAMLVAQAIRSFYLWTGVKVTFDEVYAAVFGAQR